MKKRLSYVLVSLVCCALGFGVGKLGAQSTPGIHGTSGFKLFMVEVPAQDIEASVEFYERVFELPEDFTFARNLSQHKAYHLPISHDGVILQINEAVQEDHSVHAWFAVDDLNEVIEKVIAGGGQASEPFEIPMTLAAFEWLHENYADELQDLNLTNNNLAGNAAMALDPEGNEFFLIEFDPELAPHFRHGEHRNPLTQEQVDRHQAVGN
jgi:predicted enzyme related to lactoylglutathione lyase